MNSHKSPPWRAVAPAAAGALLFAAILVALITAPARASLHTLTAIVVAVCAAGLLALALALAAPRRPPRRSAGRVAEERRDRAQPDRTTEEPLRRREARLERRERELDRRESEPRPAPHDTRSRAPAPDSGAGSAHERAQIIDSCVRIADGVEDPRVKRMLATALEQAGVRPIEPRLGAPFDDTEQIAVSVIETAQAAQHETIAAVVRSGYRDHDRLLRPAEVQVYTTTNSRGATG